MGRLHNQTFNPIGCCPVRCLLQIVDRPLIPLFQFINDPLAGKCPAHLICRKCLRHCTLNRSDEELASGDFSKALAWWDECIAAHKAAGAEYIVVPSMRKISTLKDLQTYCRYFNEVGARCAAAGMKFGYHNHSREFEKIEDKVMLDYMLENTDPDKVLFEMDVYWTVMGKASPVDYFKKYPGRFRLLHIKDRREIGQSGMVGFDAIFANAREAGVENIIVEIEGSSYNDIVRSVRECADYLLEAPFVTAFFRDK